MRLHLHQHRRTTNLGQSNGTHSNMFGAISSWYILNIRSLLNSWCRRITRLSSKFNTLVDAHPAKYVDALLSAYHASYSDNDIREAVLIISRYQDSIERYEHKILQVAGACSEWSLAHQLSSRVREVGRWIEEVACLAAVDPEGLTASHAAKQLLYQVVETSATQSLCF